MPNINMPWRHRVAGNVMDLMKKAAVKIGVGEQEADRFVLRSVLMSAEKKDLTVRHKSKTRVKGKVAHAPHRTARSRTKAARREQRRKDLYRKAQA